MKIEDCSDCLTMFTIGIAVAHYAEPRFRFKLAMRIQLSFKHSHTDAPQLVNAALGTSWP